MQSTKLSKLGMFTLHNCCLSVHQKQVGVFGEKLFHLSYINQC